MTTIVKYANRKLYNKDTAAYVNVSELVKLPMGSFRVLSHYEGEITNHGLGKRDVTTEILLGSLSNPEVDNDTKIGVMEYCTKLLLEEAQ